MTYNTDVAADSPSLWWKLDEASGTSAADSSGNGRAGTASSVAFGTADCPAGMSQTSASFNGSASQVTQAYDPGGITAFSAEVWVKPVNPQTGGNPAIWGSDASTYANNLGFTFFLVNGGTLGAAVTPAIYLGNGTTFASVTAAGTIPFGSWSYLAVTWNGTTLTLYVNGSASGTPAGLSGTMAAAGAGGVNLAGESGDYAGLAVQGAIYQSALSAVRVGVHWTDGSTPGAPAAAPAALWPQHAPQWRPAAGPGAPGATPFTAWPAYGMAGAGQADLLTAATTFTATAAASLTSAPAPQHLPPAYPPQWFPGAPGAPGQDPFTAWPLGQTGVNSASLAAAVTVTATAAAALTEAKPVTAPVTVTATAAAALTEAKPLTGALTVTGTQAAALTEAKPVNAATTVTGAGAASLTVVKAGVTPEPAYPPRWFPSAPGIPAGDPFTAWPSWTGAGVPGTPQDVLGAASVITATSAAALTEAKPVNAAATITATRAAALTEAKPLTAAVTVTAAGGAAETTAKPLTAAQTVTATAVASLAVVKAGTAPVPAYPPAWFPGAPAAPGAKPFTAWPPWTGAGAAAAPVDTLTAAQVITATAVAALTEAKPLNAARPVTATATAALTTAKPVTAAVTVTVTRTAAETTAKPVNAAAPVTATAAATLTDVAGAGAPCTAPARYVPAWFPGAPFIPAAEPFTPWPSWTGAPVIPPAGFTIGALTAADTPTSTLGATNAASALTASTAPLAAITAGDQRTGGPS